VPRAWTFPVRKARIHALTLAAILWAFAVVVTFAGPSDRSIAGPIKGADFVHFYTIGDLVRTGRSELLYDFAGQHKVQGELVPEAADLLYLPVYPPQAAIILAPFSAFTYRQAMVLWTALTIACYALIVWAASRPVSAQLSDQVFLAAAAAAFPPLWQLVLHGQTTIIVLTAFCLGWVALERRRPFLAGCAFALMAVKPQFGLTLAVVTLARRDWPVVLGAVVSIALQAGIAYALLDATVFQDFLQMARVAVERSDLLEPKSFQSHTLLTIARLAPSGLETVLWMGASALVLWTAARVWCLPAPLRLRLSAVIIASVLVSPHLMVYDATVLALPLIWMSAAVREMRQPDEASWAWAAIYLLFATLLAPTAAIIGVQLSVLLLLGLFVLVTRLCHESSEFMPVLIPQQSPQRLGAGLPLR
jgi:hypothetical protein